MQVKGVALFPALPLASYVLGSFQLAVFQVMVGLYNDSMCAAIFAINNIYKLYKHIITNERKFLIKTIGIIYS